MGSVAVKASLKAFKMGGRAGDLGRTNVITPY